MRKIYFITKQNIIIFPLMEKNTVSNFKNVRDKKKNSMAFFSHYYYSTSKRNVPFFFFFCWQMIVIELLSFLYGRVVTKKILTRSRNTWEERKKSKSNADPIFDEGSGRELFNTWPIVSWQARSGFFFFYDRTHFIAEHFFFKEKRQLSIHDFNFLGN